MVWIDKCGARNSFEFKFLFQAPRIFSFAFNIVKNFLDEYTISKINIYKNSPSKWLPAILERVDPENLPKYFGGKLTDSDGNPKCLEKLVWGGELTSVGVKGGLSVTKSAIFILFFFENSGKIPKEFYITQEDTYNSSSSYQTVNVKKGSKLKLNFNVDVDGVYLKWDFKTHNNDIKFGVRSLNTKTGEKVSDVDLRRIEASEREESGFITCQANHKCNLFSSPRPTGWLKQIFISDTVVFDNSYSYFKSKKLTYSVVTTTPLTEIEESASKIKEKIFDQNENDISEVQRTEWAATPSRLDTCIGY